MTRDDRAVRAGWDETLEAWVSDATAPGSGADQAAGPAGPAGVCVLRSEGATLSQCTMTGRVTSLWFEEDPTDDDRALLGLVLDEASARLLDAPAGADGFDLGILPVPARTDAALLAILADAERHVPMDPASAGAFLLQAELAAVITRLQAAGHVSVDAVELDRHLTAANRFADDMGRESLRSRLPEGVQFDPVPVRELLRSIADDLHPPGGLDRTEMPAVKRLRDAAYALDRVPLDMGNLGALGHGSAEAAEPVAFPDLFARPSLRVIANNDAPLPARVSLRTPVGDDGTFSLGALAPRQVGLRPLGGTLQLAGPWCTVTQPIETAARLPMSWWVIGLRQGRPVGAAPCTTTGDDALARFTVTDPPDELVITGNPLRVDPASHLASLGSVDRLCRAAFWARRTSDPRALQWFAHGAVAWFELGRVFRAGWAWQLADRDLVQQLLAARSSGDDLAASLAALESVVVSGDLPSPAMLAAVPTPAWVHAVDLERYARGSGTVGGTGNGRAGD